MRKNVAGQIIAFQMTSSSDGETAVTAGSPTVYYTIDGGTQGTGGGTSTHEGNGQWSYAPAQAETNGDHVIFTMVLSGAITQAVNVYPVAYDPTNAALGLNNVSAADVNAQCDTAISDAALATAANLATVDTVVDAIKAVTDLIPDAGAMSSIATSAALATVDANVDAILVDTGTTLPATLSTLATASALATVDSNVDAILVDTGTTLPGTLTTIASYIDTEVAAIKAVTDLIPDAGAMSSIATSAALAVVDSNVDAILLDTAEIGAAGAGLTALATASALATVDSNVDTILVDTGTTIPGTISTLQTDVTQIKGDLPARVTKNAALLNFPFLMVDSTDFATPETGLTVAATRSIDGAAFASCANSPTELANGMYLINLDATDLNGDTITLRFTATGAADRFITIVTQP